MACHCYTFRQCLTELRVWVTVTAAGQITRDSDDTAGGGAGGGGGGGNGFFFECKEFIPCPCFFFFFEVEIACAH